MCMYRYMMLYYYPHYINIWRHMTRENIVAGNNKWACILYICVCGYSWKGGLQEKNWAITLQQQRGKLRQLSIGTWLLRKRVPEGCFRSSLLFSVPTYIMCSSNCQSPWEIDLFFFSMMTSYIIKIFLSFVSIWIRNVSQKMKTNDLYFFIILFFFRWSKQII